PGGVVMRCAVVLLENAAHPYIAGGEKGRAPEPLAGKIGRRLNSLMRIDEHKAVPETPMQKYRQRQPRVVAVMRGEIGGGVELAQIKFLTMTHAVMTLAGAHAGEHNEVDAVGLDRAVGERAHEVVAAGREGELQAHCTFHPGESGLSTRQPRGLETGAI